MERWQRCDRIHFKEDTDEEDEGPPFWALQKLVGSYLQFGIFSLPKDFNEFLYSSEV